MKGDMDKSLFFITLSMVCVWLVVDTAIGKKHLLSFLFTLFPFIDSPDAGPPEKVEAEQGKKPEQKPAGVNLAPDKDKAPTMGKDTPLVSPKMFYGGMRK